MGGKLATVIDRRYSLGAGAWGEGGGFLCGGGRFLFTTEGAERHRGEDC